MAKTRLIGLIESTLQEIIPRTLKSIDVEKIMVEKLGGIDWQEKAREAVDLGLKIARGIVE